MSTDLVISDLKRSALAVEDLGARPLSYAERSALELQPNIPGYTIPYYDIEGKPTSFYRARLFDYNIKYKQSRTSNNAVYFPKMFRQTVNGHPYVVITEGEKKAAACDKFGIPCCALGGVYSWRSRTINLPTKNLKTKPAKAGALDVGVAAANQLTFKIDDGMDLDRMFTGYADGFEDFVELVRRKKLNVIIIFDSEQQAYPDELVALDVQKAAARLGFELRKFGVPLTRIKQIVLPLGNHRKMGLDDFLATYGNERLEALIAEALANPRVFPVYPHIQEYLEKKLHFSKLTRGDYQTICRIIISDLDAKGRRIRATQGGEKFYFDNETKVLMPIQPAHKSDFVWNEFYDLMYRRYSLTKGDGHILNTLSTMVTSEEPVDAVQTRKGLFCKGDTIYYQINSSEYITISGKSAIEVFDNGSGGVLFENMSELDAGGEELEGNKLEAAVMKQIKEPLTPWWYDTLRQTRIKDDADHRKAKLAALIFYTSPWLLRWRGTQLPVELITGEAGSGKSTLYGLRLNILTGRQDLRNRPQTLKDWHASVLATGGLHVIDNANLDADPSMGQAISDEMCRMVTEPVPTVEMRKYFTERDLVRVPVNVVFAMTSVKLPFRQLDLMQRAFHLPLDRGLSTEAYLFDSDWAANQISSRGGRTAWVAHHITVLHKFFKLVEEEWTTNHKAKYRLINLEQILCLMAKVFGWDHTWIPEFLSEATKTASAEVDWILQGLKAFVKAHPSKKVTNPTEISNWAEMEDDFQACQPLVTPKRLALYVQQHRALVASTAGLEDVGDGNAKSLYQIKPI